MPSARDAFQKLKPRPFAPYLHRSEVSLNALTVPARYIICRDDHNFSINHCRQMAARLGVTPEIMAGDHDVMLSRPRELARKLVKEETE